MRNILDSSVREELPEEEATHPAELLVAVSKLLRIGAYAVDGRENVGSSGSRHAMAAGLLSSGRSLTCWSLLGVGWGS